MSKYKMLTTLTAVITVLGITSCGDEVIMYEATGMKLNGHDIMTFTDAFKETSDYKSGLGDCGIQEIYVYDLDGVDYYYESEYFESIALGYDYCEPFFKTEYMVNFSDNEGPFIDDSGLLQMFIYIQGIMIDREGKLVTDEELLALDFIQVKNSKYITTGKSIQLGDTLNEIREYSQAFLDENKTCLEEYNMILYEDDEYEYIYTYKSCNADETQHVVKSQPWFDGFEYTDIDEYINRHPYRINWEIIENTDLGDKVPKSTELYV